MTTDERPPAERLLAAAEELFGERSYGRTTVADICARAGMATGSFYAYFDSKAEIFAAVVRAINRDLRRAMAIAVEQADDNQRARERACFRAFFDMVSKRPWIDRIVRESEFVAPGLFREYYEQLARGYARGVRVAQLAGEVDARYDPEVVAYVYTGIGNFVGMRWADWTAGGRVPDDVLDDVLELFARGLAPAVDASPRRVGPGERSRSTPLSERTVAPRAKGRAGAWTEEGGGLCRATREGIGLQRPAASGRTQSAPPSGVGRRCGGTRVRSKN
jgi:AcrR family transcriptional regulator